MSEKPEKPNRKVIDVTSPGKSAPSATSRPIIVNHGPLLQDPMMQQTTKETEDTALLPPSQANKVIERQIEPDKAAEEPEEAAEPEVKTTDQTPEPEKIEPEKTEPEPEPTEQAESTTISTQNTTDIPTTDDAATVDAVAEASTADKKKAEEEQKALEEHKAQVNQLVTERKYFVPLSVGKHKQRHRTTLVILIILALVVGGAAFAVQAGYLDNIL